MTSESLVLDDGWFGRLAVAVGSRLLPRSLKGGLTLTLPSGRQVRLGFDRPGMTCDLQLKSYQPVWSAFRRASVGFAESYMAGQWDSSDMTALLRFYLQNRDALDRAGSRVFNKSIVDRVFHLARPNTRKGSRRNISEHYDLGNDFYAHWLDETMSYSSGYFARGATTLAEAQDAKYRLVLSALQLDRGARILEIGCGWGGFAEVAANEGHKVTGLTISAEQLAYAQQRLGTRAELRFEDYRDAAGTYDAIASIEMIEAVGEKNWPTYFQVLRDRLRPGGHAGIQAITIDERFYQDYRRSADFIQRYIFPGGMLPTKSILAKCAAEAGLGFEALTSFGHDYARTLALWRERFDAAWGQISQLGFDESFRRRWRYYLSYCEAGFAEDAIDVGVYRFRRLK